MMSVVSSQHLPYPECPEMSTVRDQSKADTVLISEPLRHATLLKLTFLKVNSS